MIFKLSKLPKFFKGNTEIVFLFLAQASNSIKSCHSYSDYSLNDIHVYTVDIT